MRATVILNCKCGANVFRYKQFQDKTLTFGLRTIVKSSVLNGFPLISLHLSLERRAMIPNVHVFKAFYKPDVSSVALSHSGVSLPLRKV